MTKPNRSDNGTFPMDPTLDPYNQARALKPLVEKFRDAINTGVMPLKDSAIYQKIIELVGKSEPEKKESDEHENNFV